jgi:hypothetical protein
MAWFAAAIPYITTAATTATALAQSANARNLGNFNARVEAGQAKAARQQALREEEGLRRGSRLFHGRQAAAIAQSGVGSGGTAGILAEQSGTFAELDALTTRYQGMLQGSGLLARSGATRWQSNQEAMGYGLLAGGELLAGGSNIYRQRKAR